MFDDMIPWEKDLYISLMIKQVEEENLKAQLEAANAKATGKARPRTPKKRR
jgi:hypothetical protein